MPTHRNTNKWKYKGTKIDNTEAIITLETHTHKQTNLQTKWTSESDYTAIKPVYVKF